jgi:hypothetical protein
MIALLSCRRSILDSSNLRPVTNSYLCWTSMGSYYVTTPKTLTLLNKWLGFRGSSSVMVHTVIYTVIRTLGTPSWYWVTPPFLPSEQPQFVRAWTPTRCQKHSKRDDSPGWWQCFQQLLNWLDVLWVVDNSWYTWETVECEKPSSVAVLDTLKPVRQAPTTILRSKALKCFVLPIHPLSDTYTQSVSIFSRLKSPITCLLPFSYTEGS